MKGEFLLEIGCEEIPARMLARATANLQELLERELHVVRRAAINTFATPRRLVAYCADLKSSAPDQVVDVKGPPEDVAYDSQGRLTRAGESFASKYGLDPSQLIVRQSRRGPVIGAVYSRKGQATRALLKNVLPQLIPRIEFARTMYWTSPGGLRFVRPIRWVVALWAGKVVPFEMEGVPSGDLTYGHRQKGNNRIRVRRFSDYVRRLKAAGVMVDPAVRRGKIEREAERALKRERLRRHADNDLLDLVVNQVEHPTVILGDFDSKFMELPGAVLITVMRHHQKYFSVEDRQGRLQPKFLAVVDQDGDRGGLIRRGHETVLAARFRDAEFFWKADQKRTLADRKGLLDEMVYESRLGSFASKVARVAELAEGLAAELSSNGRRADIEALRRAALLAKCDLSTEMVGEFPELQGVVGGLYARAQGEGETVAQVIAEHYLPNSAEDKVPASLEGSLLAVADKLDSVAGCFAVGHQPTGSRDPYALRRAAMGIVRIVVEGELRVSTMGAVDQALKVLKSSGVEVQAGVRESVLQFIEERARYLFRDLRKYPYDEVNAAFAAGWDDLVDAAARLKALRRLRGTPNFEPVAASFKRIRNILAQAGDGARRSDSPVEEPLLEEGPERELYQRLRSLAPRVAELRASRHYQDALRQIASLRPQVDRFFDKVLVMAQDEKVRENRLRLLAHLLREFSTVADFSEIVVTSKEKE